MDIGTWLLLLTVYAKRSIVINSFSQSIITSLYDLGLITLLLTCVWLLSLEIEQVE